MKETLNHWHIEGCPLLPRIEFWPFLGPLPLLLTLHTVKNHRGGGAEGEPGGIARERRTKENGEKTTQRGNTRKQQRKTLGQDKQCSVLVFRCSTTPRELQTCTFQGTGASNTTKIPRKDPQEREEKMKIVAGEEQKNAKFWASHPSGPTLLWSINSTSKNWPKSKLAEVDHDLHFGTDSQLNLAKTMT